MEHLLSQHWNQGWHHGAGLWPLQSHHLEFKLEYWLWLGACNLSMYRVLPSASRLTSLKLRVIFEGQLLGSACLYRYFICHKSLTISSPCMGLNGNFIMSSSQQCRLFSFASHRPFNQATCNDPFVMHFHYGIYLIRTTITNYTYLIYALADWTFNVIDK